MAPWQERMSGETGHARSPPLARPLEHMSR
jgi:hypothetical protein